MRFSPKNHARLLSIILRFDKEKITQSLGDVLVMQLRPSYVLLLVQRAESHHGLEVLLENLKYSVEIVSSIEQAVAKVSQIPPCLVILEGSYNNWPGALVRQLRALSRADRITIVCLSDCNSSSWPLQADNPGFDGFLVKPISSDILSSLVYAASARQFCCSTV